MKLWLIEQDENNNYDTYDCAVVAAATEDDARQQHPNGSVWDATPARDSEAWTYPYGSWCSHPDKVTVRLIGEAAPDMVAGVVVASFNAG